MRQIYKNILMYVAAVLGQGLIYTFTGIFNKNPFQLERALLLNSPIDTTIPFVPESIWFYCLYYLILCAGLFLCADEKNFPKFLRSFISLSIIADIFFILIPVGAPTGAMVLLSTNEYTASLLKFILAIDNPSNCFPSLHCAHSFLITFWFYESEIIPKYLRPTLVAMTLSVVLSTLLVKQHWFADIVGAAFLFFVILRIHGKQLQNQSV